MKRGIVGFRVKINHMEGKAKLSQNHPESRQKLVINELKKIPSENHQKIARLMEKNIAKVRRRYNNEYDTNY